MPAVDQAYGRMERMSGGMARTATVFLAAALGAVACGGSGPGQEVREPVGVVLEIVDSIGMAAGDTNLVLGSIDRACRMPDGSIVVLDRIACCIRRFGPDGTFVGRYGRRGSGPGEYLNPSDMVVLGDGRVMVCDIFTGGVHLLDTALVDQGVKLPFYADPPFFPVAALDSSFVAGAYEMRIEEDAIVIDYFVGRFDMASEPSVTYRRTDIPVDPSDATQIVDVLLYHARWAVDPDGNVFVAPISTDTYEVTGYRTDGTEYMTITRDVDPVPRSEEEIALEEAFIENRMISYGSSLPPDYHPSPWRPQIVDIHADGEGRIWVQRGTGEVPEFDVYDPAGVLLYSATVPGAERDGRYWRFFMDGEGILAWSDDPPDHPVLYLLEASGP